MNEEQNTVDDPSSAVGDDLYQSNQDSSYYMTTTGSSEDTQTIIELLDYTNTLLIILIAITLIRFVRKGGRN